MIDRSLVLSPFIFIWLVNPKTLVKYSLIVSLFSICNNSNCLLNKSNLLFSQLPYSTSQVYPTLSWLLKAQQSSQIFHYQQNWWIKNETLQSFRFVFKIILLLCLYCIIFQLWYFIGEDIKMKERWNCWTKGEEEFHPLCIWLTG